MGRWQFTRTMGSNDFKLLHFPSARRCDRVGRNRQPHYEIDESPRIMKQRQKTYDALTERHRDASGEKWYVFLCLPSGYGRTALVTTPSSVRHNTSSLRVKRKRVLPRIDRCFP